LQEGQFRSNKKVIVIGLDGGSWNIIEPLMSKGKLPTIATLVRNGSKSDLESSIPPVTFPAWKCYSCGKNPDNLGVYWWMDPDFENKKLRVHNSRDFRSKEIWDYLGKYNIKCGVIGMPTTYPPKRINGFMVSEFGYIDSGYTYPVDLETDLRKKYNYTFKFIDYHGANKKNVALDRMNLIKQRFNAAIYLVNKYQPDFFHFTVFHIDNIQHFYFKFLKENDPVYGRVIENAWMLIDRQLKLLLCHNKFDYILIISDHGFCSLKAIFNIYKWLSKKRYFILKNRFIQLLLGKSILRYMASIPYIKNIFNNSDNIGDAYSNLIDWNKSKVIPTGAGVIHLNKNFFTSYNKREKFINKLIKELESLHDPFFGNKVVESIYKMKNSSGIVILPKEGYEIISSIKEPHTWINTPREEGFSGIHKLNGIFIAYGKDIKKNFEVKNAKIIDIAPTILHIFGVPIPDDMDGRVLTEIFEENSDLARRPIVYSNTTEKKKIKEKINKLRTLGKI